MENEDKFISDTPLDITEDANKLVSSKSRDNYEATYRRFMEYRSGKIFP